MNPTKRRLYLQLGRIGDVLNILPLAKRDFDATGVRPLLLVAERYRELLDGATYVEPVVWAGDFEDVNPAHAWAAEKFPDAALVCTQIYGRNLWTEELCSSFLRESWARVPDAPAWGSLPLVFDRRDPTREAGVKRQLLRHATPGRPYVVLALNGTSSPFPNYSMLVSYLRRQLGREFDLVDVSAFLAPRFYDLLGLLAGAHAIVAVDSAVLHLAHAVPEVPVVAFITREPSAWHGSAWRPQHAARYFYDETPECFADVVRVLAGGARRRVILHAWTSPEEPEPETAQRIANARETWDAEDGRTWGFWVDREFRADLHARRDGSEVGDPRPTPFARDVIDRACSDNPSDVVAFTNADSCFVPGLTGWILDRMSRQGCAYTHRWDFKRLRGPFSNEADVQREGEWYPGSDAFFFTVGWWRRHRDEYPDLLVGREQVDEVLRQLIKRHGGLELPAAIYHEKHASYWDTNRAENPGNQYNRRLARRWFLRTGYGPNDPWWWQIPNNRSKKLPVAP